MATKLRHICAVLMAVLLIVSSIGVPVNEHFCRMSNNYEVSLLPIAKNAIKLNKPVAACCNNSGKKTCCKAPNRESTQRQQSADKSCCSNNSEYLFLEIDMLISSITKAKMPVSLHYFFVPYLLCLDLLSKSKAPFSPFSYPQKFSLPCSLQVCAALQVFLC